MQATVLPASIPRARATRRMSRLSAGIAVLVPVVGVYVYGALIGHWSPNAIDVAAILKAPSASHWFGTDQIGRDQLARVAAAIPDAFILPVLAVVIALAAGGTLGVIAGCAGRFVERLIMWATDLMLSMPSLLLAIIIVGVLGNGRPNLVLAIAIVYVPQFSRLGRAAALEVRRTSYMDAARLSGIPIVRTIMRHVVPNVAPKMITLAALSLSTALLTQAGLSFIGLGVVPPQADLGDMLSSAVTYMSVAPWLLIFPSIVVILMVLGFNFVGDGVSALLDPQASDIQTLRAI